MLSEGISILVMAGVGLVLFVGIALVFSKLYVKASKEQAFIRTGMGNQLVVMDGGALVFPVLHEIIQVNMNTLRLVVMRRERDALITKDRMRVDVQAEFYVRVGKTKEAIAAAAQTLGRKTLEPEELKQLIEGKFVDALRSVAASMTMMQLHEKRQEFVAAVQHAVQADLSQNGLELESVSLTGLDQTDRRYFNPENAFDAEGLAMLTRATEERRKERNEIEQATRVDIERRTVEADKEALLIQREGELARIEQQKLIDEERAKTEAEIAKIRAEQKRIAEEAEIERNQAVEAARVQAEQKVEIVNQQRQIAVASKSMEEADARAQAEQARAKAILAAEQVETVRERERAEREKQVAIIKAEEEAEQRAVEVRVKAAAEKAAAEDRAQAIRIEASAQADAEKIRAEGIKAVANAEAEGIAARNAAENTLLPEVMDMRQKLALIDKLDRIVAEAVRPLEKIDGIKIVDLGGGVGRGAVAVGSGGQAAAGAGGVAPLFDAALAYRGMAPVVDEATRTVLDAIGATGGLTGLVNGTGLAAAVSGLSGPKADAGEAKARDGDAKPRADRPQVTKAVLEGRQAVKPEGKAQKDER